MPSPKSVCLITGGLNEHNFRLQPWRYLYEVAYQLAAQGHQVTAITDGATVEDGPSSERLAGPIHQFKLSETTFTLKRIPDINQYRWKTNQFLHETIQQASPDVILWHLGMPSFAHQQIGGWANCPVIGIYPGLVYGYRDFARIGLKKVAQGYKLSAIHLAGSLLPKGFVRGAVKPEKINALVTQTDTTRQKLVTLGLPSTAVKTIGPGIDPIWSKRDSTDSAIRRQWGVSSTDKVILYFGSPAPLRGLHTLLQALKEARRQDPSLKLVVLNRRHKDELLNEDATLRRLITDKELEDNIQLVTGFLEPEVLVQHVAAADIVALPFELVPADAPLSILEAQALGKPIVTTSVASLPELSSGGLHYLAEPADADSLSLALLQAARDLSQRSATETPQPRLWREVGIEWSELIQSI